MISVRLETARPFLQRLSQGLLLLERMSNGALERPPSNLRCLRAARKALVVGESEIANESLLQLSAVSAGLGGVSRADSFKIYFDNDSFEFP